jgi:hypothetical protein
MPPVAQIYLIGRWPGPLGFVAAGWSEARFFRQSSVARFARAAFASFHITVPVICLVVIPAATALGYFRGVEHPPERWDTHKRCFVVRIRKYAACVKGVGSDCITMGLLEPRKSPPTLASRS